MINSGSELFIMFYSKTSIFSCGKQDANNQYDMPQHLVLCTDRVHPTDKTPQVYFVIGGQKPPHVFLKADKTPHAQKYNVDKTPHADFKIRTNPPPPDKQMEADISILMQTTCIFW